MQLRSFELYALALGKGVANTEQNKCWFFLRQTNRWKQKSRKYQGETQGETSSKDMTSSRDLVSTIGAQASPKTLKGGRNQVVRKGKAFPAGMSHPLEDIHFTST